MNTNAVAYKKIGDSIKKRFKKTKFHKDNPNMFKGGDVKIHPGAKKDSSKDAPKNQKGKLKEGKKYTKAQLMAKKRIKAGKTIADVKKANKEAMIKRAKQRNADFKKARKNKNTLLKNTSKKKSRYNNPRKR